MRIEQDIIGKIFVPKERLWGAQTQRSLKYFKISNEIMPYEVIRALVQIKKISAKVNYDLKLLDNVRMKAIIQASDEILSGKYINEFPLSVWQTGSGTQSNMNVNEVLANRANQLLEKTKDFFVHPNDHVNKGQSSNDVFPSAMHIAAVLSLNEKLLPRIQKLINTLIKKSISFKDIIKIGRTHLQDATPLTLGQEISGWISMLQHNVQHIKNSMFHLYELALGGTTVGTGLNTHPEYAIRVISALEISTKYPFITSKNKFESLSTCDALVYMHGALKGLSVSLMKIANDIRLLGSGPRCGIGELNIPQNEPGSSIMPGKVNPTQCEAITMICCQVMGNDVSIGIGGSSGQLQLNVYRPLIIYNFLQSVYLLSDGIQCFHKYCIIGMQPRKKRIRQLLHNSLMLVTAIVPYIGYDKAAQISKKAYCEGLTLKDAALMLGYVNEEQFDKWILPEQMLSPSLKKV